MPEDWPTLRDSRREEKASSTALLIAASMAFLAERPATAHLVPPETRKLSWWLLRSHSRKLRLLSRVIGNGWFYRLARGLEAMTIPGIIEHWAQRKVALEKLARAALENGGAAQLIVLGAGFDTLACRMATQIPGLRTVEVDSKGTGAWKKEGVQKCELAHGGLSFATRDLREAGVIDDLVAAETVQARPRSFWVAEGLFMYFEPAEVSSLLAAIRLHSPAGSRLAFTYMEPDDQGHTNFRRRSSPLTWWLRGVREPFRWGIRRMDLPAFLAELGFCIIELPPDVTAEVERLAVGEHIALAEVC